MVEGAGDGNGPPTGVKSGEAQALAGPRKATLGDLLVELKRRRVFRVMVGYAIFAFAVLQVVEPMMHGLDLPGWTLKAVIWALAVGFPVALILAWLFDLTAQGVKRTPSAAGPVAISFSRRRLAALLVAVGLVGALPGVGWYLWKQSGERGQATTTVAPSIAVLPFADMSPQHDQEYFADGIAEEILNALAQVDGLRVPGRTSSFYFKGKSVKLADIGRELRVGNVLEGSVRKEGSRVRITVQLVRIDDESHVWSETYERELTRVFAVQDEIAKAVVHAMKVKLSPGNARPKPPPRNPEAYTEYLLGRHLFFRWSGEDVASAAKHFERAVALDPEFAPAWAMLSIATTQLDIFAGHATIESRERALAAAEKAITLAPDDAAGYVARTFLRQYLMWDWAGAQADVERALVLKQSYLSPHNQHAQLLGRLGRSRQAIAAAQTATDLDPLNGVYWLHLARAHIGAGNLDLARAALIRCMEINPGMGRSDMGLVDLLSGSPESALVVYEGIPSLKGVALAKHDLGRAKESQRALDDLIARHGSTSPCAVAEVYAWRGERDKAFEWLQRAYDQRDLALARSVKANPLLRNLHDDPRWKPFLRKMNLPVD